MGKPRLSIVARAREVMPRGLRILSNIEPGAAGRLLVVEEARVTWTSISSSSLIDTSPSSVASDIFLLVNRCVRWRRNSVSTQWDGEEARATVKAKAAASADRRQTEGREKAERMRSVREQQMRSSVVKGVPQRRLCSLIVCGQGIHHRLLRGGGTGSKADVGSDRKARRTVSAVGLIAFERFSGRSRRFTLASGEMLAGFVWSWWQ